MAFLDVAISVLAAGIILLLARIALFRRRAVRGKASPLPETAGEERTESRGDPRLVHLAGAVLVIIGALALITGQRLFRWAISVSAWSLVIIGAGLALVLLFRRRR